MESRSWLCVLSSMLWLLVGCPLITEQDLAERLTRRKSESEEEVARRLAGAKAEMARMDDYDYVVVNDDLDRATETLRSLIQEVSEKTQ